MKKLLALIVVSSISAPAIGADCPWYKDIFGICSASQNIEKGMAESARTAGDKVFSTFNYWAKLIEDYHTGTPEQKEKARLLLKGVFGLTETAGTPIEWEVRVDVKGLDATSTPLRVAILRDYQSLSRQSLESLVRAGDRVDFSFRTIRGQSIGTPEDPADHAKHLQAIRAELVSRFVPVAEAILAPYWADVHSQYAVKIGPWDCGRRVKPSLPANQGTALIPIQSAVECGKQKITNSLADAVLSLADKRIDLRTKKLFVSAPWQGQPYLTILVPESDLAAHKKAEFLLTVHKKGNPDEVLPEFRSGGRELTLPRFLQSPTYSSPDPTHGGKYKAVAVTMQ